VRHGDSETEGRRTQEHQEGERGCPQEEDHLATPQADPNGARQGGGEGRSMETRPVMPRIVAALLASLCWVSLAAAQPSRRVVDLNEPGILQALESSSPGHYRKIRQILDEILAQPDPGVPRWLQTTFDARNVKYIPVVLTSHPPKRQLSFSLDDTRYEAVLVLTHVRGDIMPAR
jgi:hypothetical protein